MVLGSVVAVRARVSAVVNALAGLGTALISDHPKARLVRPLLRAALGWSGRRARSHTLVQNPENAKFVESLGVPAERISLVRGAGVDTRRFRPRPEPEPEPEPDGPVRVMMVSRLVWDKGVREFVEAAVLVRGVRDDVTFTLVGAPDEGNPTSVPAETVRSWVAEGLVEWWGHRDDVAEVLARSHVAVLASYKAHGPKERFALAEGVADTSACALSKRLEGVRLATASRLASRIEKSPIFRSGRKLVKYAGQARAIRAVHRIGRLHVHISRIPGPRD